MIVTLSKFAVLQMQQKGHFTSYKERTESLSHPLWLGESSTIKWFDYKLTWLWRMTCEIYCERRKPNRPRLQKPLSKKRSIIKLLESIKWKIKVRVHRRRRVYSINLVRLRPVACFCRQYSVKNFLNFPDDMNLWFCPCNCWIFTSNLIYYLHWIFM